MGLSIPAGFSLPKADLEHVDGTASGSVSALKSARIFITGGTGLFGLWAVESLLYSNATRGLGLKLTVLTRDVARAALRFPHLAGNDAISFVPGDITDFDLSSVGEVSHVLHLASEGNVDQQSDWPLRHYRAALMGTERVLDLARRKGVESVLMTTSGAVYLGADRIENGRFLEGPSKPCDLTSEKAVYGEAKRMSEVMAAVCSSQFGFRAPIARCFAFVGPYLPLNANYAIGNFMRDAIEGKDIIVAGDGTPLRSYLYMADLASWLITLLVNGPSGVPVNVGGEEAISIADLARLVARLAGRGSEVIVRQKPVLGESPNTYLPDLSRAKSNGLAVNIGLEDAILRSLSWYRNT